MNTNRLKMFISRIPILDIYKQIKIIRSDEIDSGARILVFLSFIVSLGYFVLPFDIIPDILLGIGYIDDLGIYIFLREVGYQAAENDCGVVEAINITLKSKIFKLLILIFSIITICVLALTYFWISWY